MSIEYTIYCNGCGDVIESSNISAAVARSRVREQGGRVNLPGGKDLCDECVRVGEQPV